MSVAIVKAHEAGELRRGRSLWDEMALALDDLHLARKLLAEELAAGYETQRLRDWHANVSRRLAALDQYIEVQRLLLERERLDRETAAAQPAAEELAEVVRQALGPTLSEDICQALNGHLGIGEDLARQVAGAMASSLLERITNRFEAFAEEKQ